MKHVLEMTVVLLAITCAAAQSPKPATQPPKPATASTVHKPAAESPASVKASQRQVPFEIVSAKRIDSVQSRAYGNSVSFHDPQIGGVVVVLKSKSPEELVYFSTAFSLGWGKDDDPAEIPRRPCIGVSFGSSKTAENDWDWLLGGVGRHSATSTEPYFAVVFAAPKNVNEFTLYYATPAGAKIKLSK